ncbi:leucine--tRNA ligase [Nocardioides yefusunii]|uniref:Leucine--tRNA ligase n=1 Tax=Nocardioides yefusunii TaxID=2500546 RepID=A0ABW1R0U8_9ACTN|nr:leucine--tRNA ligase [Nocardioides yefusunii]
MSEANGQTQHDDEVTYDVEAIQAKWLPVWEQLDTFRADDNSSREKKYALTMFPYPSGDLHMGHAEVMALHDVKSRFWRMKGYEVLNPMGWDSFGLPAENAAIKNDEHPAKYTYGNIETQYQSFKRYGTSFDWSRRFNTSDPEYYKWTQWLFTQMHAKGLAYRKNSPVNWCPNDQTVLANEQVVDGACERCGAEVTKRELTQWYFRTTAYAQELLDSLDDLAPTWPSKVVNAQRNWIGRSEGAHVTFDVTLDSGETEKVTVFTTRPDTLWGASFMVVAADAELANTLVSAAQKQALEDYLVEVRKASDIDRLATDRPKSGVDLGVTATNPVTGEQIPVWASDYVLADYGTGAIMAVPAHDQRDLDFAKAFDLPVRRVIDTGEENPEETFVATTGNGVYVNSGPLDGLEDKGTGIRKAIEILEADERGTGTVNFRLRDWLLSRQRYWGAPIPIVHCPVDGEVAVPAEQLPVLLPDLKGADLKPKGTSPLGGVAEWVNTTCPTCGGPAERDTDTMDTFVDSSWYFFRYISPQDDTQAFDSELANAWGPVDLYVGGDEHAVLHLLYSRFFTKAMRDMGLVTWDEPFSAYLSQGKVLNQGRKMSKSLGNGVNLGDQLDQFGVDAVRLTLVFASPPEDNIDWADVSPASSLKFLQRAWRLSGDVTSAAGTPAEGGDVTLRRVTHKTIADAEQLIENHRYNVVIARTMELVNATRKAIDSGCGAADPAVREAVETVATLLSLIAPYTAEEMWERLGHAPGIAAVAWPTVEEALLVEDTVTAVVQIKGKVKARLDVAPDISEADLEAAAMADAGVQRALEGLTVRKVIVKAPKLVNIVV